VTHHYPKRLIEVDFPIKRISAHARRKKSIRHGHISTPGYGGSVRSLARCGPRRALPLMLGGRSLSAKEARRQGLVDWVVPERQLADAAHGDFHPDAGWLRLGGAR